MVFSTELVAGVPRGAQNFGYVSTYGTICFSHFVFLALSLAFNVLLAPGSGVTSTDAKGQPGLGCGNEKASARGFVCDMSYSLREGNDATKQWLENIRECDDLWCHELGWRTVCEGSMPSVWNERTCVSVSR